MREYLSEAQRAVVQQWWEALQPRAKDAPVGRFRFDRGPRARLRRAPSLQAVEAEGACFALRDALETLRSSRLDGQDGVWLPLVCGVLAHVDDPTSARRSLAMAMGRSNDPDRPPVSEIRFRRLMSAEEPEELFHQLRRALRLAVGGVNVPGLANDLLAWCDERAMPTRRADSMHYTWAKDYYLNRKDQKIANQNAARDTDAAAQESHA